MLRASGVGAGHANEGYAANSRRTSSSMLADPLMLAANPSLRTLCTTLQSRAWRLLCAGAQRRWLELPCLTTASPSGRRLMSGVGDAPSVLM